MDLINKMLSRIEHICLKCSINSWIKIVLLICTFCSCHSQTFRIAWLAPDQSSGQKINSYTSVSALKLALTSVTANPMILQGHDIRIKHFPTDCTSQGSMQAAMRAKIFNPDVIIGPPCEEGMRMVAQLCAYWNLPVFTWYNPGIEFDNTQSYPTLVRMIPSLKTMGISLLHLFRQNKWRQFAFVYDDSSPWTLYEDAIRVVLAHTEVHMLSSHGVNSSTTDIKLWQMFSQIKKYSFAVVFACPMEHIRRYMLVADQAGMGNGNYVFIQLDHQVHSEKVLNSVVLTKQRWMRGDFQDQAANRIFGSLIHVLLDPMNDDETPTYALPRNRFDEFSRMAIAEAGKQNPGWTLPLGGQPDVYSLFLYDAILVWSVLADRMHTAGKNYRDGKLLTREARQFFADGATGYFALNDNVDRIAKIFILNMEIDGSFKPSQILRFNSSDGYSIINIKPLHMQTRHIGGQTVGRPSIVTTKTTVTTPTPTATTATTPAPVRTASAKAPIPRPPTVSPPALVAMTTPSLISELLAKVQSLEKTIKQHELHSHGHIPDHTHTPHPLLARLSSTQSPPVTANMAANAHIQAFQNHPVTTPAPLSLDNLLGPHAVGHAHFPHQHIHLPTQPTNHIHSVTNQYNPQGTIGHVPAVYGHTHHPHHWHPHPHYPHYHPGNHGISPGTYMHHVHMPTTPGTPSPPKPKPTTPAPTTTTTTLPPPTTVAAKPTPTSFHEHFNGNGQIDEAMLNRISSRIVDQLTGTNTTHTNAQEGRIVNDWLASGLDELGPGLLLAAQAFRAKRILRQESQRFYKEGSQNTDQNNQQQTQNAQTNNQAQPQQVWQDPLAAVLDPLANLWGPPLVW